MSNETDLLRRLRDSQTTITMLQDELAETNRGLIALTLELERREEHLRTVVTNAPVLLLALDHAGVVTLAEGTGLATLGLQPAEVLGVSAFELYRNVPKTMGHIRRALAGEALTAIEQVEGIAFETHWLPLRDKSGQLDGVIGVATDITERRRAEQRTRASLDALVAMAEAIVLTTGEQEAPEAGIIGQRLAEMTRQVLGCKRVAIVVRNPETDELSGAAIAGFTAEEAPQWWLQWERHPRLSERLDPGHLARLHADEALILDRTQPPFPPETAFDRHTVLMVPLRVGEELRGILSVDPGAATQVFTADEIALVRTSARLVTLVLERDRLLQERAEARANEMALREANRRMEEFLSIAGHELRTPLTSVLGNVQLAAKWVDVVRHRLAEAPQPGIREQGEQMPVERLDQVRTVLQRMERQGRVLSRLVNDVLDASRSQAGQLELRPVPSNLAELVRDAVQECRQQTAGRTMQLEVPDAPVPVLADAERLTQVLSNYLSNALKYSDAEQPITIGLQVEETIVRVWVRDRGPGLPPTEHERVWERFYRVAGITHRDGSSVGLGLGLHISRGIVERHGGQVGVESSPGAGATFWFTIPLAGQHDS